MKLCCYKSLKIYCRIIFPNLPNNMHLGRFWLLSNLRSKFIIYFRSCHPLLYPFIVFNTKLFTGQRGVGGIWKPHISLFLEQLYVKLSEIPTGLEVKQFCSWSAYCGNCGSILAIMSFTVRSRYGFWLIKSYHVHIIKSDFDHDLVWNWQYSKSDVCDL